MLHAATAPVHKSILFLIKMRDVLDTALSYTFPDMVIFRRILFSKGIQNEVLSQ